MESEEWFQAQEACSVGVGGELAPGLPLWDSIVKVLVVGIGAWEVAYDCDRGTLLYSTASQLTFTRSLENSLLTLVFNNIWMKG